MLELVANYYGIVIVLHALTAQQGTGNKAEYQAAGLPGTYIPVRKLLTGEMEIEKAKVINITWSSATVANHFQALSNIHVMAEPLIQNGLSNAQSETMMQVQNEITNYWSKCPEYSIIESGTTIAMCIRSSLG